jgi:colanic acid biosynthesis glycosyl transferase WcaI
MHICIINEYFYPDNAGGTGTVLSDLVRSLRETFSDIEVDVVTSNNLYRQQSVPLPAYEEWNGVRIFRLATPRPNGLSPLLRLGANLLFCLFALTKLMRLGKYDAVLVGTAPPMVAMCAQFLKWLKGTPFVYIVYDLEPDRSVTMKMLSEAHPAARIFRASQKRWLHSAAKVVVLGRCMQERLSKVYSLPLGKIEVIPIGSDPEEISPRSRQSRFREKHGINGFVVLYSGNFGRYHNFDTVLDAAAILAQCKSSITFVLVGEGAQKEHIAQRIAAEKIGSVRMFPFVSKEDYADLLATADVSLVTLEPGMEGLCVPSKFYSILASGRPTIAAMSPVSEVARVIDESQCGVHFAQDSADDMVSVLRTLADDPGEVDRLGRNARAILLEKYSTGHLALQYHATLIEAAQGEQSDLTQSIELETLSGKG